MPIISLKGVPGSSPQIIEPLVEGDAFECFQVVTGIAHAGKQADQVDGRSKPKAIVVIPQTAGIVGINPDKSRDDFFIFQRDQYQRADLFRLYSQVKVLFR